MTRTWSIAGRLFALQASVIALVLAGAAFAVYLQLDDINHDATAEEMLAISRTLATMPDVLTALDDPDPSVRLQPLAERVRAETSTDFVVVMSVDGTRFSHPDPAEIGGTFRGTIGPAADGAELTETFTGTLGPSIRAVVPVYDGDQVVALVSVGRTVTAVSRELATRLPLVAATAVAALLLAAGGSWLVSRWLRRSTHDLGPAELSRMYEYYDAVLHAVREGLVLVDAGGRVRLVNDEARRLLNLSADPLGRPVHEIGALGAALADGAPKTDEIHLTADRIVVVNQAAARGDSATAGGAARRGRRDLGTVVTLRDHTELRALGSELREVRGVADSLGAQAHEAANRLHTVVSLIELGRAGDALEFATTQLAVDQRLTDAVLAAIAVPELAALVVAKAAQARERGVRLDLDAGATVPIGIADARDLVTIVGNLLDNAIDAALDAPPPRRVLLGGSVAATEVVLRVSDTGPGLPPDAAERAFSRGWSTKQAAAGTERGLGLALVRQAVQRHGGRIDVAAGPIGGMTFAIHLPRPIQ